MMDAGLLVRSSFGFARGAWGTRVCRATACAALVVGAVTVVGCARDARPPVPVQARGVTAGLRVYIKTFANADPGSLVQSYSAAMRWAGFETVAQEKDAELVAELRLRVEEESDDAERLAQVELVVKGNNVDLGATSVEYDYNAPIPASELSRLTLVATQSEALDSYALEIQQRELTASQRSIEM